ncbi:MAG: hypothetical protein M0Q02_04865 [Candidatus Muirbacterium halophilum]|nr:hypothetical protein [Candidatus Muirbacterium halophilum]
MSFIHVDSSFLPFKEQTYVENIFQIAESKQNIENISIDVLKKLSKFVGSGFSDFTFQVYKGSILSIWPRNTLHRMFFIYFFIEKNNLRAFLFDRNAKCVIKSVKKEIKAGDEDESLYFKEKDFFRNNILDLINETCDELLHDNNIELSDIAGLNISGYPFYLFLLFDFRPPVKNELTFIKVFPVLNAFDIGLKKLHNALIKTDEISVNSIDFLFIKYFVSITDKDFLYIKDDFIACYSLKDKKLHYIDGITENRIQEKITDIMKTNLLKLPINLYTISDNNFNELINWMDLSDYTISDNIEKEMFDIGNLGIW